jgi:hypothetical protein
VTPFSCLFCANFCYQALAQVCAVCSPLRCVQNSCYGLMVAVLSDSMACKVKSRLLHFKCSILAHLPKLTFRNKLLSSFQCQRTLPPWGLAECRYFLTI